MVQKFLSVVLLTPPLNREEQQIQPKRKQGNDAKRILIGPRTRRKYLRAEVAIVSLAVFQRKRGSVSV
jgi:hypothetical protein